jgi:hypothetical protein
MGSMNFLYKAEFIAIDKYNGLIMEKIMAYTMEWEGRGVCWTFNGALTGRELLRSNLEIYGDERFDNMRYQIVDLTQIDSMNVSAEDMKKIAAYPEYFINLKHKRT